MPTRFDPATGGLIFTPQEKDNEVIIKTVDDIPTTIDSGKVYFIDGFIDIGATEITVPTGGMYVSGHGYGISGLYSTEDNHTMFKTGAGTYAGDVIITGCTFYTTGTNSKILDYDNDSNNSAIEFNSCNLGVFGPNTTTSLGEIANVRILRTGDFAAINYNEGLTVSGDMGGVILNDGILLANVAGTTFLKEGTSLVISSGMSSDMNALSLATGSVFCDFDEANFGTGAVMSLSNFRTNLTTAIPNLPSTSIKALFRDCVGITNTVIGASWELTTTAETTITASNTPVKFAGTTTPQLEAHFSHPTNNRLQYNGERPIAVQIGLIALINSPTKNNAYHIYIRHWDASASTWTNIDKKYEETILKGILLDRTGKSVGAAVAVMDEGDYIEAWVENTDDSDNVTLTLTSKMIISER